MMAITTVSALPATEADGTICAEVAWKRRGSSAASRAGRMPATRLVQG